MTRRIQFAGLIAGMTLAMGTLATHLMAYATNGHIWGVKQIPFYVNPQNKYMSESSAVAGISSAASAWRGLANIDLVYAGNTTRSSLTNDGVNVVFFRDDSSGFIAETYWWWDGSGRLVDADIVYHQNYKFYSGNMGCNGDGYYIENTGAHEFGHFLGLAHSSVDTATMWPYSGSCEVSREIPDPDDIAGLRSLYPGSSTTTTVPAAPTALSAAVSAANPSSSIALVWADNATDESGYTVERSLDGATFSQRAQLAAGATAWVDSSLASGTIYYYRVSAYNSAGASPFSNVASSQTQASAPTLTAPNGPSGLAAAAASANPTSSIALSWADNSTTESGFIVERSTDGASFSQRTQLGSNAVSFVDSGLSSGTTYYYRVYAFNSVGSSGYSNVAAAQTQAQAPTPTPTPTVSAPSAPTNPSPSSGQTGINSSNITLSWSATNAQSYDVFINGARVASVTNPSYRPSGLSDGTTYSWTVVANNSAGSTSGPTWTFSTKPRGKK